MVPRMCVTHLSVCVFQAAFWQNRSVSLLDMYIDNSEPSENIGQIQFSLEYDHINSTLLLRIIQVPSPSADHLAVCSRNT